MPNEIVFLLCATITLAGAIAAMTLRNLVHCALCAAGAFAGLAALYLQLNAEFAGFAQLLVYVGAIAILIVFTVLLTRGADIQPGASSASPAPWMGVLVGALVFAGLVWAILASPNLLRLPPPAAQAPVKKIGEQLMSQYIMPLETIGLLLTAALLGAVVIALREPAKTETPAR
ncbi:MAG TPA: NADH-quinone oxidoreductase subunit J [Verrucomicrobiae bacterium]|jgi:NADH-quinone oxidoreductase subunit J